MFDAELSPKRYWDRDPTSLEVRDNSSPCSYTTNSTAASRNWRKWPHSSCKLVLRVAAIEKKKKKEEEEEEKEDLGGRRRRRRRRRKKKKKKKKKRKKKRQSHKNTVSNF